ncbi:MAG: hypothetical protein DRI36_04215 [Caldiserica bacterium]|nr:MAG: hypothetical protein DRI36_04215 [Caldisericota bacterium]
MERRIVNALNQLSGKLSFSKNEKEMLYEILSLSKEILGVEGVSLLLLDREKKLHFYAAKGEKEKEIEGLGIKIPLGQGIAGWVAQIGKPAIVNDTISHPKFLPDVDEKIKYKTRSVLCVPLIIKSKVRGVIEAVNKKEDFTEEDLEFLQVVSGMMSIILENYRFYLEVQKMKNFFKSLLDNMPGGFIAVDDEEKIVEFNQMAGVILGVSPSLIIGKNLKDFPPSLFNFVEILKITLNTGKTENRKVLTAKKPNGEQIVIGYGTIVIKEGDEKIIGAGIIFQDLSKIKGLP